MKKVLFSLFLFLILSLNINALEYSCTIESEKDYFTTYKENALDSDLSTSMNINITNIENISSLSMHIKYDNKKYETNACQFLNYTTTCSLTYKNDSIIYYDYKYSDNYKVRDFPFFYVNFLSNKNTPSKGSTKIEVSFSDAKDKDGNKIDIKSCFKTFNFIEEEINNTKEVIETNKDIDVLITGYEFEFDKDTYEYNLEVDKDVTSLDVKVLVSDEYKYTLTGATDLNSYGNKVTITIIDADNKEKVYTINVIKEKEEIKKMEGATSVVKNIFSTFDVKKIVICSLIIIVALIILIVIIKKLTSRKIDKFLDKM